MGTLLGSSLSIISLLCFPEVFFRPAKNNIYYGPVPVMKSLEALYKKALGEKKTFKTALLHCRNYKMLQLLQLLLFVARVDKRKKVVSKNKMPPHIILYKFLHITKSFTSSIVCGTFQIFFGLGCSTFVKPWQSSPWNVLPWLLFAVNMSLTWSAGPFFMLSLLWHHHWPLHLGGFEARGLHAGWIYLSLAK